MFNIKKKLPERLPRKVTPPLTVEFNVGDIVKVCSDENKVKEFQNCKKCGGYSAQRMQCILGKSVKVKYISQYCIKVEWEENEFDLHPNLIEIINQKQVPQTIWKEIINENEEIFFDAVEQGNILLVYEKLTPKMLNKKYIYGRTPINIACVNGRKDLVEIFLDFNADLNISDNNGYRPIQNSTLNNYHDIINIILKKNKDQLHTLENSGKTLLHIAILQNNYELAKYFIEQAINTDIKDESGNTAFQYVTDTTDPKIKELMIQLDTISIYPSINSSGKFNFFENDLNNKLYSLKVDQSYYERYMEISLMEPPNDISVYETISAPSIDTQQLISYSNDTMDKSLSENLTKQNECEICYNRPKKIAFVSCGHTSCDDCAKKLFQCHICMQEIIDKLVIYM